MNDKPVYYNFDWQVKDEYSGNDYGQTESRNGELTTGLYQVLLPDGRHQVRKERKKCFLFELNEILMMHGNSLGNQIYV